MFCKKITLYKNDYKERMVELNSTHSINYPTTNIYKNGIFLRQQLICDLYFYATHSHSVQNKHKKSLTLTYIKHFKTHPIPQE
jgi:hypothetical protein